MPDKISSEILNTEILINGNSMDASYALVSIDITRALSSIGSAELVFALSFGDGTLDAGESNDFAPGSTLEIRAGYDSKNESLFKGIIVQQGLRMDKNQSPVFMVQCSDEAIKMTIGQKSQYFQNMKDSDVIRSIIGGHSPLSSEVETTVYEHHQLIQFQSNDWDFILARAAGSELLVYTDGTKVMARKPEHDGAAVLKLGFGINVYDFDFTLDVRAQMDGMTSKTWEDETPSSARMSALRGTLKIQGNTQSRLNVPVTLEGFGSRFNGDVLVTSLRHVISDGNWFTTLGFGLPSGNKSATSVSAPAAGGLFSAVHGLHNGTVRQIAQDPEGEYRILVEVPVFDQSGEGIWARLAQFYAGAGAGSFFLPEPGDEVILGFLNDDPRYPVILGMMYSSKNKPPYEPDAQNKIKGIVTRNKLSLSFDDENKVLTIQTPGGNEFTLSDQDKSIRLKDQNGHSLLMDSSGITLKSMKDLAIHAKGKIELKAGDNISADSAGGDIRLEGKNVSAVAKVALLAQGTASAELKSAGQTTVKGAIVMIN